MQILIAVVYICSLSLTPDLSQCGEHQNVKVYYGVECTMASDCFQKGNLLYMHTPYYNMAKNNLLLRPKFASMRQSSLAGK